MKNDELIHKHFRGKGGPKALLHEQLDPRYKMCQWCMSCVGGAWCINCHETLYQRSYTTVYENRVEWNRPLACCCCLSMDMVSTLYLDKALAKNADKAGPCSPCCTHNHLFPDCCGLCGETLVLHNGTPFWCCNHTMIRGLHSAEELKAAITEARKLCHTSRNQVLAAPVTAEMTK